MLFWPFDCIVHVFFDLATPLFFFAASKNDSIDLSKDANSFSIIWHKNELCFFTVVVLVLIYLPLDGSVTIWNIKIPFYFTNILYNIE